MYTSYFGFKENPFSLTPDPNYLYLSRHHKEAFDHLVYGINERKGFIVITGGIGTGKTTLCRALLGTLDSSMKTALIFNAYISDMELLRTINQEFGIGVGTPDQSKKDHIDNLNQFLLETFSRGGNTVLLIDEAQNLSHMVLEQIRMLSNLETEKEKLVQIVLVGQLELKELLASPALKQLDERIMVRYDLKPLGREDVRGYIEHRLVVAGGKGNVRFTKGALQAIYGYSRGNPRRINGLCDRSLLIAYAKDEFTVSRKTIQKAIEDIGGVVTPVPGPMRDWAKKWFSPLPLLVLLIVVLLAGFGGWGLKKKVGAPALEERVVTSSQTLPVRKQEEPDATSQPEMIAKPEVEAAKPENTGAASPEPSNKEASLFLSEQAGLAGLFSFRDAVEREDGDSEREVHWGLYMFDAAPEHHIMFKKPFWVRVTSAHDPSVGQPGGQPSSPQCLLIRQVTADGAVVIDADSKERAVSRDFILTHWAGKVYWVYPYEDREVTLMRGMRGPDVVKLQYALNQIGYTLKPTGRYDEATFREVINFQSDFGLKNDGIVGTRTKGLLYQMTDELY